MSKTDCIFAFITAMLIAMVVVGVCTSGEQRKARATFVGDCMDSGESYAQCAWRWKIEQEK